MVALRNAVIATVLTAALGLVQLLLAPTTGATTVLFANGATFGAPVNDPVRFAATFLGGAYRDDAVVFLDYPASVWPVTGLFTPTLGASVEIGTANMVALIKSTPGPVVVAGASEGALVVQRVQAVLNGDPGVAGDTSFIIVADPNSGALSGLHGIRLPILAYRPQPLPETRFDTVVVVNQYDPVADPIARPWNLLTVANAGLALPYVHVHAQDSDLSTVGPANITTTTNSQGGTTTTYFVPTPQLPLTMPLRQIGVPSGLVDAIDDALRPAIDAGYRPLPCARVRPRPDTRTATTRPVTALPVSVSASARKPGSSSPRGATGTSGLRSPVR